MQPAASPREGEPEEPGMSEEGAAFAVLGIDIESIGIAVARHWGLDDGVLHMVRRQPMATAPHSVAGDGDLLRAVASCGNEAVDALALPAPRVVAALHRVVSRYGRLLDFGVRELQAALQGHTLDPVGSALTAPMPLESDEPAASTRVRR
jgi:non-specific serine/threonine protein kinase